jgi:hypothetical protein
VPQLTLSFFSQLGCPVDTVQVLFRRDSCAILRRTRRVAGTPPTI